ncbi:prepilin peptidase [Microbacterium sp.]|uniref:prepilin peptidase n=1 Tax=Microbacterium sp. TaxID=51671 RepID=UPI0037364827
MNLLEGLPTGAVIAVVLGYLWLALTSVVLATVDVRTHRLPNAWVLPGYLVLGACFLVACLLGAPWGGLLRAAVSGILLFAFYLLLRALGPGGMGGGDVKLAGVLGLALGWAGWEALTVGAIAGFVLGGLYGVGAIVFGRASAKTALPFGPWMLLGAWIGILFGAEIASRLLAFPI